MTETDMKKEKRMELLAPAGTLDICKAVINAGADAVYLGGQMFGARAFAGNLSEDEISEALDYAHLRGAKIYLTLNTLLEEKELKKAYDLLKPLYLSGLDAVIVQDFGVLKMIRESFPDMAIHASTQMAVMEKGFASYLKDYGVKRIVLPREFTLEEAKTIKEGGGVELEAFVHGALCYCYSGQCMLSAMRGNRSGNRGTCAQPCRLEYEINGKKSRFLSARDIAAIEMIPQIAEAGIFSLKIEGRMKNVNYAAGVTSVYRKYVDMYLNGEKYKVDPGDMKDLMDLYNRGGFSKGFFAEEKGRNLICPNRANHQGTKGLKVKNNVKGRITFEALENIGKGDVFETAPGFSFTSGVAMKTGEETDVNLPSSLGLKKGQIIYRVNNAALQRDIHLKYVEGVKKVPVKMECECRLGERSRLKLILTDPGVSVTVEGEDVQEAKKSAVSVDDIRSRLSKLGDTEFEIEDIRVEADDNIFISNGGINRLRRDALDQIVTIVRNLSSEGRKCFDYKQNDDIMGRNIFFTPKLNASVCSIEQLNAVQNADNLHRVYVSYLIFDEAKKEGLISDIRKDGREVYIAMPYILTQENANVFEDFVSGIKKDDADGILVRSLEEAAIIGNLKRKGLYEGPLKIVTDTNIYSYNHNAADFIEQFIKGSGLELESFTLPLEPDKTCLEDIVSDKRRELIIYGRAVAMRTKHCVRKNTGECDGAYGMETIVYGNEKYPVMCFCDLCNNIIFDSRPMDLTEKKDIGRRAWADTLRLDFTTESFHETLKVLDNTFV